MIEFDEIERRDLAALLTHPGWPLFVRILEARQEYLARLALSPDDIRPRGFPIDRVRGEWIALELMQRKPLDLVESYVRIAREQEEQPADDAQWNALAQDLGLRRAGFPAPRTPEGQPVPGEEE
jgi:hypothetical protein